MSSSTPSISSASSPPSSLRPLSISTSSSPTDDIPPAIRSPLTPLPHLDSASHAAFVTEDRLEAYRLINIATREQLRTLVDMLSLDEMRSLLHRTVRGVSARRVKEWKQRLVECRAGEGVSRPELCLLGLPRELCCNIFQYLDVYTMWFGANFVSRAWRKTVQSPDSWRVVTFPSETWGKLLKSIIDNKHRKSAHSPYSYMQRWMPAWTRVHHLQFMPEPVCVKGSHTEPLYAKESTLALLEHYMASLAHLRILDLNASRMRYVKDMHLGYIAAGASCRKLEELHVNCSAVTDEGLKLLASGCTGLRRLELASLSRITDHGIKYIIKNCIKLEHLQLKSAREITNESVQTLVQSCPKLTQLTITSMGRLTHVGIEALQSLPELQHLDLSGCRAAFTPSRGLDLVTRKCKSLEHLCLDMIDIPATAFQHIATDLPKLNTLICSTAVTDESLISLSTGVCSASLESLVCKGITAQITDRGILALVSGCPILHTLHLGAPGITNLSLLALSLYCPNLKMLSFSSPLISDQGLKYLCTCTRPLLPVDVVRPAPAPKEKRLSTSRNPTTQPTPTPAPAAPQPPPTLARFDHRTNTTYYTPLIDPKRDNSPAARAARRQQQLAQIFTRFPSIAFLPAHFSQSFEEVRWIHQQPSVDVDIRVHPVTGRCTLLIEPSSLAYPNQYSGSTLPPEMKETSPVIPTPVTAPGTLPMPHTHLHPHGVPPPSAYPPGYTGAALANMNMTQAAAAAAQLPASYIPSFAAVPQHTDTAYGHSPDPEYDQDESFQFEIDGSAAEEKMAFPIPPPPQASTAPSTLPTPPPASLSQPGATSTSSAMSSSRLSVSAALVAATATSASGARAPIQHSVSSVSSTNQAPMSGFPARLGSGPAPTTSTGVAVHGLGLAAALSTGPPVGLTRHGAPLSNVPATATATANTNLAIANISDAANAEAKSIPTSTSPSSMTPASTPVPPPARRSRSRARVTDETASGNNTSRRASSPSSGARPSLVSSYSSSSSSQHILSLDDEDHLEPMDGTSQETDNTTSNTTSTSTSTAIPHHNKSSTRHTPSTSMSASYTMDDDDETQFGTSQPDATFFPPPTGPSNDFPSSTPASTSSLAFSIPQSGSTSLPTPSPTTAPTSSRRTERKDDVADLSRRMAATRLEGQQPTSSRRAAAAAAAAAAGSGSTTPAHSRATSAAVPVPGVSRAHRSAEHGTSHNSRRRPSSSSRDRRSTGDERKHSSSVSGAMDDEAMEVENDDVSVDGDHPRDDGELEIELDEDGNGEHPSGDVEGEFSGEEEETEHDGDEWLHGLVHLQSMATKLDYIFSMHQKRKAAIQATQGPCSGITCLGFGSNGGIDEDLEYELKQQIDSITGQGLGCPKLEALAVQHCLGIRDISVLVTGCPRLNTLLLNGCVNISGDQLRLLAQAPSLKSVRCSGRGSSERAAIDYLKFLGFEVKHSSSNRF